MAARRGAVPASVWATWLLANVVGGALIALPDRGPRLFSISRTHGPSAVYALGAAIVLAGWLALDIAVARRLARLRRLPGTARAGLFAAVAAGALVLVPTIALDLGAWWVAGAALLAGARVAAALAVGTGQERALPGTEGSR